MLCPAQHPGPHRPACASSPGTAGASVERGHPERQHPRLVRRCRVRYRPHRGRLGRRQPPAPRRPRNVARSSAHRLGCCTYCWSPCVRVPRRRSCTSGLFFISAGHTHSDTHAPTHSGRASHEQRHKLRRGAMLSRATTRRTPLAQHTATAIATAPARIALAVRTSQQRRATADATVEPAAQISWGTAQRCRRKWAEPAAQRGARAKGWQC